jgi:hypothetical protein
VKFRTEGRCVVEDCGYETPCWVWQLRVDRDGYGRTDGRLAHRVSYETHRGPIPEGLTIDHLCRIRACVNPGHLEAVTMAENVRRGESFAALNARKTHCPQGHPLSGPNLMVERNGARRCRACRAERLNRAQGRDVA